MASILKALPHIQAYAHPEDIDEILKNNPELSRDKFVPTADGFTLSLPLTCSAAPSDACPTRTRTRLKFIHTPGHTPGSQCILANETSLFSGDTLFVGSCGRIDFPESNPQRMWASLSQTLQSLDDAVCLFV